MNSETKQILLFGAGKSATVLIRYLLDHSDQYGWKLLIVDTDLLMAQAKINGHPNGSVLTFDIRNAETRRSIIQDATVVISMLPPALHSLIAEDCVAAAKNLLTASYVDEAMRKLETDIAQKGLLFLCEMGLDPGIDHMSALQLIHNIERSGGIIKSFVSHCGGLIAPESDNNPWHYKITWNPANVVSAGKSGAVYKLNGEIIREQYADIFKHTKTVAVTGQELYASYPNRDSLPYLELYGLKHAHTFIRTTLRHPDFCRGWKYIVDAGLTSAATINTYDSAADWFTQSIQVQYGIRSFDEYIRTIVVEEERELVKAQLEHLGLNSAVPWRIDAVSSADILRQLLEAKLAMQAQDKDMIVMQHEIGYEKNNQLFSTKSCMIVKGDDAQNTAMAKTVGLPLGIATELILEKKIKMKGLVIPLEKEIYEPVLIKLKEKEIKFEEL